MKVLVADKLAPEAVAILKKEHEVVEAEPSPEELLQMIPEFEAVIVRSRSKVPRAVIEKGAKLKVVGRAGIGTDNIDVAAASERKIPVVYAPTGSTFSVSELTIGFILALARGIPAADRSMKAGKWEKKKFKGMELKGKTLGLVGIGRIGAEVSKVAQALGMTVIACDPYIPENAAQKMCVECMELDRCVSQSDFVSIHCILNDETRGMVDEHIFKKMKKTAYIINCARGGIIDEEALFKALSEGWIAGAALDVYAQEPPTDKRIVEMQNVICTPHIAASTVDAQLKAGTMTAEQVSLVLAGKEPEFCVNKGAIK